MCGGYLHVLGMVHDCKWIAATFNRSYPKYEMKNLLKKGYWIGLFYLILSDISADIYSLVLI
jgi:hypothetical protein